MDKMVLVTGGEGFIGSNLVAKLLDRGYQVEKYVGDIRNFQPRGYYPKFDFVIHLAALAGVRQSHQMPDEYWDVNVTASKKIFDYFSDCGKTKILYASSSSIYQWWKSPYSMTKKAMEEIAPENSIGLRFFTVFGPNSRGDMFFDMLLKDRIKYVTDHQRDWTHVDDVTDGIILLMEKGEDITGCVDVGCGSPCSVEEVAEKYGKGPYPIKDVEGEATYTCANACVLESLGWKPKHHILTENIEDYE